MKFIILSIFSYSLLFIGSFGQSNNNNQISNTLETGNNSPNNNLNIKSYAFNQGIKPYAYGYNTGIQPYSYSYSYPPINDNNRKKKAQVNIQNYSNHQPHSVNIPAQFQNFNNLPNQPPIPFNFNDNILPNFDNNLNSAGFSNLDGNTGSNLVNFGNDDAQQLPAIPNIGGPAPPKFVNIPNLGGETALSYFNPNDYGLPTINQANDFDFGGDNNNGMVLPNFGFQSNSGSGFPSFPELGGGDVSKLSAFGASNSMPENVLGFIKNQDSSSDMAILNFNTNLNSNNDFGFSNSNNEFDFNSGSGSNIFQAIPLSSEQKQIILHLNSNDKIKTNEKVEKNGTHAESINKKVALKKDTVKNNIKKEELEKSSAQNWPLNFDPFTPYAMLNLHPDYQNPNQGVYTNFAEYRFH